MITLADLPAKEVATGFFAKFVHGERSTLAIWDITKGSGLPGHRHPHEQITFILEGELEMTLGEEVIVLSAGSAQVIPSNTFHSAIALQDSKVIDAFSPARDDYR